MSQVLLLKSARARKLAILKAFHWGRHGFDVGNETLGACRGAGTSLILLQLTLVANDDNYALAA